MTSSRFFSDRVAPQASADRLINYKGISQLILYFFFHTLTVEPK